MSRKPRQTVSKNDTSNKTADSLVNNLNEDVLRNSIVELENRCYSFGKKIQDLENTITEKNEEISHLKKLLEGSVSSGGGLIKTIASDEENIAELQLLRLKQKAENGELTLEEVKKFDLLVKNKRLAQGNPTTIIPDYTSLPENTPRKHLLKLASTKIAGSTEDDN